MSRGAHDAVTRALHSPLLKARLGTRAAGAMLLIPGGCISDAVTRALHLLCLRVRFGTHAASAILVDTRK